MNREAEIQKEREKIDQIDRQVRILLNQRAEYAQKIGHLKGESPVYRPEREAQVLRKAMLENPGPLSSVMIFRIQREIMSACLSLEKPLTIGYQTESLLVLSAIGDQFGHFVKKKKIDSTFESLDQLVAGEIDYLFLEKNTVLKLILHKEIPSSINLQGEWGDSTGEKFYLLGLGILPESGEDKMIFLSSDPIEAGGVIVQEEVAPRCWWVEIKKNEVDITKIQQEKIIQNLGTFPLIELK